MAQTFKLLGDYEIALHEGATNALALAGQNCNEGAAQIAGVHVDVFKTYGYLAHDDKEFCGPLLDVCRALELLVIEDTEGAQYTNEYLKDRAGRAYARFASAMDTESPTNAKI